jgi:hypothetical protein
MGQKDSTLTFLFGPELAEQRNTPIVEIFGHSDDYFLCLRKQRKQNGSFVIEKIGTDSLRVEKSVPFIPTEVAGKLPVFAFPFSTKSGSYLMATAEDPESQEVYIMAYPISENLSIPSQPVVLGVGNREALISEDGFLIFKSTDGEKLVLFIPEEDNPAKNEKFTLRYFDSQLSLLDTKKIEIPYRASEVFLEDAVLTASGVLHGIISIEKESKVRSIPDSYALLSYNPREEGVKEKALALGTKWFYDLDLTLTPDTNLWLSGYYSNMVEPSMAGTFSVLMDSHNGELLKTGLSPFDRDFRLIFRRDLNSDEDDLGLFQLDKTYLGKNETLSMVSEKRYERQSTIFNPATGMYNVILIHYHEEIMITTIKPNSRIVENILIPKYQNFSRTSGRYTSYTSHQWKDGILVFYNDHAKNTDLPADDYNEYRALSNENNIAITYCLVEDGTVIKRSLDPKAVNNYYLDAEFSYDRRTFQILTAYKENQTRYIKVLTP